MRIVTSFFLLMWSVSSLSQNLVTNGDFDNGLTGWIVENATATINLSDGLPGPPSAQQTTVGGASGRFLSNCIPFDPNQIYVVRANVKVLDGATSISLVVHAYGDSDCSETSDLTYYIPDSSGDLTWKSFPDSTVVANDFSPTMPVAVRIGFHFGGGAPGNKDTLVDHVDFRVQGSTPVQLQSFGVN